jgi:hypothetical protein
VLAYLRKGETFAELAAGFGVGMATAWRYVSLRREALFVRVEMRDLRLRPVAAGRRS